MVAVLSLRSASAQDPNYVLSIQQECATSPQVATRVLLDSTGEDISGWSFGVCHDVAVLQVVDVLEGPTTLTMNNGAPPWFNGISMTPTPGGGYFVATVVDSDTVFALPPGTGRHLYSATYEYATPPGSATTVDFCDTLGTPPVQIMITLTGLTGVTPTTSGATLAPTPCFFERGDCNVDGGFNIADAVCTLTYLFNAGPAPCKSALDVNDDSSLNIADAVYALSTLFSQGPPPLPPFGACGADPTPDTIGCVDFSGCP